MDKHYKYFDRWSGVWKYTDNRSIAMNNSYYSQKPYYKLIGEKWHVQDIPYKLDLTNTDTFHIHELKNQ